jgi:hypothetical protein
MFLLNDEGNNKVKRYFDHTIKPILLYGSEVWGIFNVTSAKLSRTDDIHLNDCYKYFQGETLHLKFCKSILGLNRKSVNHASLSELGRYPLYYDIVKTILKYCYRLENLSTEFPLLQDAFFMQQETTLYEQNIMVLLSHKVA